MVRDIVLEKVYGITSRLQESNLPEVIICGKSNVGKSTFINYISNRKNIARSSSVPGKTRTINFYKVNNNYYLVDLPGYGYAKVKKEEQEKWAKKINEYLDFSKNIKAAIFLIDIRHKPTILDKTMYEYLVSRKIKILIILTKSDKIKRMQILKNEKIIKDELNISSKVISYSNNMTNIRNDIVKEIENMIGIYDEQN